MDQFDRLNWFLVVAAPCEWSSLPHTVQPAVCHSSPCLAQDSRTKRVSLPCDSHPLLLPLLSLGFTPSAQDTDPRKLNLGVGAYRTEVSTHCVCTCICMCTCEDYSVGGLGQSTSRINRHFAAAHLALPRGRPGIHHSHRTVAWLYLSG